MNDGYSNSTARYNMLDIDLGEPLHVGEINAHYITSQKQR